MTPDRAVLILIVMEDTHWVMLFLLLCRRHLRLNPYCNGRYSLSTGLLCVSIRLLMVLILIVMEDTHWDVRNDSFWYDPYGLNPYCNGRYSLSWRNVQVFRQVWCGLNPYCNGRYSLSLQKKYIIVKVSYVGLNPYCNGRYSLRVCRFRLWRSKKTS